MKSVFQKTHFRYRKSMLQLYFEKESPSTLTTLSKDHCIVSFWIFFCRPSPRLLTLNMILAECKQLPDLSVMSKSLSFLLKVHNEKLQMYQIFYVDIVSTAPSFIKSKIPTCVFFETFRKLFSLQLFLKTTPAKFFSYEFAKYLKTLD